MSRAPDYCDHLIAALSEVGYPPTSYGGAHGDATAEWDPSPPFEVFEKALKLCNGPSLDVPFTAEWWDPDQTLVIRTNRSPVRE